jgi:hypothetical protein
MRQQLSATPTALMTSIPPIHSSLGPQPHSQLPAPSASQSQSQSQSSTQAHPNFKASANIHAASQSSSLTYSHSYAHPVYAPEHYSADIHERAGMAEPTSPDDKHLAVPSPNQTFTNSNSRSNSSASAPAPDVKHIRALPAPPTSVCNIFPYVFYVLTNITDSPEIVCSTEHICRPPI